MLYILEYFIIIFSFSDSSCSPTQITENLDKIVSDKLLKEFSGHVPINIILLKFSNLII